MTQEKPTQDGCMGRLTRMIVRLLSEDHLLLQEAFLHTHMYRKPRHFHHLLLQDIHSLHLLIQSNLSFPTNRLYRNHLHSFRHAN